MIRYKVLDVFFYVLLLCFCFYSVHGDCFHGGRTYMKHTVWQPGPCTVCTCEDPIVLCETIRCTDPRCDYDKGEYLQISADSCCPECVPQLSSCSYQDRDIPHNTEWNPEPCILCFCDDGEVTCAKIPCLPTHCKPGEIIQNIPGKCCPQCIPAGRSCKYEGQHYEDGSEWEGLPCTKCLCSDGQVSCYPRECPAVVCAYNERLETLPGSCCPVCKGVNSTCRERNQEYRTGDQWHRGPCTLCVCIGGTAVCTQKECMDLMICNRGQMQITREGECCPECVPNTGVCHEEMPVRYSGDIWNISDCEYCVCNQGNVQCHTAVCENIMCYQDELLVRLPGTCCPQCVIPPSCEFAGQSYKAGDTWHADDCSVCHCDSGETICYREHCPICPSGSVSVSVPGDCCGKCQIVGCDSKCTDCLPTAPQNCTVCSDPELYIQDGHCVKSCRMGYYASPTHKCLPCDETCYTCVQGTPYHCDMCQPGLMWKHGQCVPQCGGGYYLQSGKCLECHKKCKSCNGPNPDQCTSCSNPAQVVFLGQCLDKCPDNFFIRGGNCVACHPTCKTCTPDGAGCATCWEGGLLHQGQCVARCPVGFYANTVGSCSPCHPACETCNGGYSKNCTSCFTGGRISKKGRCRSQCPKGKYFTLKGECEDCVSGCSECRESWHGDSSICSSCESKDLVPSGSECLEECKSGQYMESRVCKDCGENCLVCTSPTSCSKCIPSMLLYKGLCVAHCAQGQFEDGATMSCRACSKDCLQCYSEKECSVCSGNTYLKGGYCVRECGKGFVVNEDLKECTRNKAAPTFQILRHVQVKAGDITAFDLGMFYIADPDTSPDKLYVVVLKVTGNGNLIKAIEGVDVVLQKGDNFTLTDIMAGKVRFLHRKFQGEKDFASLKVSDAQLDSPSADLYFQVIPPTPLSVRANNKIYAETGSVTPIGRDVLDLWTDQKLEDVIISVLKGPKHGNIIHQQLKVPVQAFSLKDLQTGQMAYQPTSVASPGPDSVLLQATDNYNVLTILMEIDIRAKENPAPLLVHNSVGHVTLGEVLMITPDLLMARVMDTENTETDDAIFTLVPPLNNPQDGDMIMVVPLPETGVYPGWEDMGDGTMATRMSRFLQRDINEGRIYYKHKGNAALTDIVTFEVADTASPANILPDQSFLISIRLRDNPGQPQADPALAPGVRLGITVLENHLVPITPSNLAYEDRDTPAEEIFYSITKPLGEGQGTLEHAEKPFKPVWRFTQYDINNNRIIYRPPERELINREAEFIFYFTVTDGQYNKSSPVQKFSVRLIPINNTPPQFGSPSPKIVVSQGGIVPIGQSQLHITDSDTPLSELRLTLQAVPTHGKIEKVQDGLKVTLRRGDIFTYTEFETNTFQYTSDGSDTPFDSFRLNVADGEHETSATVNVTIVPVDKSAPYMLASASCRLEVVEGTSEPVLRDHLSFEDNEDGDREVQITLTTETVHGKLLLYSKQVMNGGRFTQADINHGHLSFLADAEIGKKSVAEILTFDVTDSSGNVVPNQVLTVVIQPDDNQPPVVSILSGIQVEEGGKVTLTGGEITVTDPDTVVDSLIIVVDKKPSFGDMIDSAPGEGSEKLENRLVSSFPVQDLINGYIYYIQSDHKNKEPAMDHFLFHATDGRNKSPVMTLNISIMAVNDEAPDFVAEQIFVQEGQAAAVTTASVYVVDMDSKPSDLVFTIVSPPTHGVLRRKSSRRALAESGDILLKGTSFSYQDILDELIVYQNDGAEVTTDSFTLHLTDGDFEDTKTVSVIIGLVNDETPRVSVNRGLRVQAGSTTPIKSEDLRSTDVDSEDSQLVYTLTQDPPHGRLMVQLGGKEVVLSRSGPIKTFKQTQINSGHVSYKHRVGEGTGTVIFKFTVSDENGNDLLDQHFYITVLEDRYTPVQVSNKELVVREGGKTTITTEYLSFTDDDTEPASLSYLVLQPPRLGYIQLTNEPGVPVSDFSQSDLAANNVMYVHTSTEETYADSFSFSVSDGPHDVIRTFSVRISPVDDSIPVVISNGLKVQEGVRKIITEFDLKATDRDTKEDSLLFTITKPPMHGNIEHHHGNSWSPATLFTMTDIYENHISYLHDGTETLTDNFAFIVSDGTNSNFAAMQQDGNGNHPITQTEPQEFKIDILPLDDGSPVIEVNLGLQFLEYRGSEVSNLITANELRATDSDTPTDKVMYVITDAPQFGRLEKTDRPGMSILSFSQADIDNGIIKYVLTDLGSDVTQDGFSFNLLDSKPNRVPGNQFYMTWSVLSFEQPLFNVTEDTGVIQVPIRRTGNLKQYSIVTCRTVPGRATSVSQGARPGQQDFVAFTGQVQFDEWQDRKMCTVIINDDSIFEGPEDFYVELLEPSFALLGQTAKATVAIYDLEDEPVLEFSEMEYHVDESDGYARATIVRSGDVSSSVSVICSTLPLTARGSSPDRLDSGSDFISRGTTNTYRVMFPSGVTMATCDVKLVDDSLSEATEQFEVELSSPSFGSRLGQISRATVFIDGPNDESAIYFSNTVYHFDENAGVVDIEIVREGTDLSHNSMVWCATRLSSPPSATPGQDYVPSSSQLTFGPGQTVQHCQLTIMDDDMNPVLEGNETFTVFLSSAIGSNLIQPYIATVEIMDSHLDVPLMEFLSDTYTVAEQNRSISVPVYRHGDVSYRSSVICYTRQQTAQVMMDYEERVLTEASRIVFEPGERIKNCTVGIVDDDIFEIDEVLLLKLAQPQGTDRCEARIGALNSTNITITNPEDVPRLHFEKTAYSVQEPDARDQITTVTIKVVRSGDVSKTAEVRCSTQDGSAMSGIDYNPKSQILRFKEGVKALDFKVDILYNSDIEWHEAFSVILGPTPPVGAELGTIHTASITILDNDVSGSIVLPSAPVVVSLLKYDDAEEGVKLPPSPGYPVVCITPCDIHYPTYSLTHTLCKEAKINQSAMFYRWEVAMPETVGSRPPFVEISDNTLFTSVNKMVLDSVYFRPSFRIRCIAQPLDEKGNPGIPLKSKPVIVGRDNGICKSPVFSGLPFSYQAQSFLASLEYIGTDDPVHPNTIHISVQVPHQDGMLPLVSTFPLHNLRFLLAEPVYRQQHVCSNIITPKERSPFLKSGFLQSGFTIPPQSQAGFSFPYQFDTSLRENKTLLLYKHLNLKTCVWKFDAWYHMTDLIDLCGGHAVSDFQVTNSGQTYLTVRVPLHVSYLYATAPIGWGSLEHRTEMEFSFYYDTVLWKTGLETGGQLGGKLQVMRILIGDNGKLVIDFKTHAKFRGLFVLEHHTLPGYKSRVVVDSSVISFDLDLVWGQNTFDGPHQLWRASSDYSLKDYTGEYTVELIPCTVQPTQGYTIQSPIPCTAHQPQRFSIPIAFQQTNRPVPLEYTLNTHFQLHNNEMMYLQNPFTSVYHFEDMDFNGAFSEGQKLYGRVLWSPEQDLKSAYKLSIEKVFICAGRDGYIPTYDPSGNIYSDGPQFGCIQPGPKLRYRFMILDKGNPDVTTKQFQNIPFNAEFADDNSNYAMITTMNGVDGFVMDVDPLFKVTSGFQWHIQVIYTIGPSDPNTQQYRSKRSAMYSLARRKRDIADDLSKVYDWIESNGSKNGTNIKVLHLNFSHIEPDISKSASFNSAAVVLPIVLVIVLVLGILVFFIILRKRRRKHKVPAKINNLDVAQQNSFIYKGNQNIVKCGSKDVELKNTTVYKGQRGKKPTVRVKDINLHSNKKDAPGTEV